LRNGIAILPQEPVLFSGTIKSNLDPFNQYNDEYLWDCLEKAHLKALVHGLNGQLEHAVLEHGENFSQGTRQMLCLARAISRQANILLLDEATANVDYELNEKMITTVKQEFAHCTVITIAHRLSTILDSDKIIVMDKGKIVEYDRPSVLAERRDGLFARMLRESTDKKKKR